MNRSLTILRPGFICAAALALACGVHAPLEELKRLVPAKQARERTRVDSSTGMIASSLD